MSTKAIILPADKATDFILATKYKQMHQRKHYGEAWPDLGDIYQHIYVISDEDIKQGDWYCDQISQCVRKCEDEKKEKLLKVAKHLGNRKIIESTDSTLGLSYPSDESIYQFIEDYNS